MRTGEETRGARGDKALTPKGFLGEAGDMDEPNDDFLGVAGEEVAGEEEAAARSAAWWASTFLFHL